MDSTCIASGVSSGQREDEPKLESGSGFSVVDSEIIYGSLTSNNSGICTIYNTEFRCSPCQREGTIEQADAFCRDCEEYFCDTCLRQHNRMRLFSAHVLFNKKDLERTAIRPNKITVPSKKCMKHHGSLMTVYCETHKTVCCAIGAATGEHKDCSKVDISKSCENIGNDERFKATVKELKKYAIKLEELKTQLDGDKRLNEEERDHITEVISDYRERFNERLDLLQEKSEEDLAKRFSKKEKMILDNIEIVNACLREIQQYLNTYDNLRQVECELFVQYKKGEDYVNKLKEDWGSVFRLNRRQPLAFTLNRKLDKIFGNLTTRGNMEDDVDVMFINPPSVAGFAVPGFVKGH
ncbi:E3 ubiquitin-protein ligase TRIM33-like isoform X2 [Mya arenaria]|uniref:E3 ubiquitin-protein ligase TRIM33-like isoform X2 n=1 Tax=Mya arenaria TaxID=6604 RepID=UPI0022E93FEA|nr:E3 ubiquitin-protein ligase TRIM33-like isoform X2 [Mya arenaria]